MGRLSDMLVLPAKAIPGQSITGQIIPGQSPEEPKPEIPHLMDLSRHHHYNRIGQLDHIEHLRLHPAAQPWQPPQRQAHRSQRYGYDAQQRVEFEGVLSVSTDAQELGRERVQREQRWHYDNAGNRIHPDDTRYRPLERAAPGNRLHRSAQARYRHDAWGNVVQIDHTAGPHKGRQVRLAYDGEHRLLVSERIQTGTDGQRHSVLTRYHYDPMSRRVGKQHLKRVPQGEGQKSEWRIQSSLWFGWDGDRMVTMQNERQASTNIYEPDSFVPMLRVDLNGEPYRADQFGFMGLRLSDWLKDNWKTFMPATVFGDLGCASSVAHMALAAQWLADPANQQQTHLLLSASDDEQRSAVILRGTFKA
jgi:hypothetical protein